MLIVPIVISILLIMISKKMEWGDDIPVTGLIVCWITYFGSCVCDMIGLQLGWW